MARIVRYADGRLHGIPRQGSRRVHAVYGVDDPAVPSRQAAACGRVAPPVRWWWLDAEVDCPICLRKIALRAEKAPVPATSLRYRQAAGMVPAARMTPHQRAVEVRRLRKAMAEIKRQVDLLAAQGRLGEDEVAIILRPAWPHLPAGERPADDRLRGDHGVSVET